MIRIFTYSIKCIFPFKVYTHELSVSVVFQARKTVAVLLKFLQNVYAYVKVNADWELYYGHKYFTC